MNYVRGTHSVANKLVIVESPAKAKTIEKYLGRDYAVRASLGHVRDLPKSKLGVDVDNDFQPQYLIPREKSKQVKALKTEAQRAERDHPGHRPGPRGRGDRLAPGADDRSGDRPVRRVEFHEITKDAVLDAMRHPRAIDVQRVDAQQARRILDRLVGYQISPLLWKKVKRGLSAGRVQSAALRMVVEREREIDAFDRSSTGRSRPSWPSSDADWPRGAPQKFVRVAGRASTARRPRSRTKATAPTPSSRTSTTRLYRRRRASGSASSSAIRRAPFTTSTLQQEASRKLGFTARRTMVLAQQLYEGIDIAAARASV